MKIQTNAKLKIVPTNFAKLVLLTDNVQLALINIHFGMEVV
jgi:hypothetical protein